MASKLFVSYKYKDPNVLPLLEYTPGEDTDYLYTPRHYVDKLIELIGEEHIYKGEKSNEDISHLSDDTIDSKLKEKIFDSSATIVLISPNMWDKTKEEKQQWIPNEISYSLRDKKRGEKISKTNGLLAIALPDVYGKYDYAVIHKECGVRSWQTQSFFKIIKVNMFNRKIKNRDLCNSCFDFHHFGNNHSYIHPVKWIDFINDPSSYIDHALMLREQLDKFEITKTHE